MFEFNEQEHEYTLNGVRIPSVSEVLDTVLGGGYDNVPQHILDEAAEWGTAVHKAIELSFSLPLNEIQERQYNDFWSLYNNTAIIIDTKHEVRIHTDKYAGTMDLLFEASYDLNYNKSWLAIGDIKTTYNLNVKRTTWQLSAYAWIYEKMTGHKVDKLFVYWLPKRESKKAERRELERKSDEEVEWLFNEYERIINTK